jgi:hexokinase
MTMQEFIKTHNLSLTVEQMEKGTYDFIAEMDCGLAGEGSLKMLPAYIDPSIQPDYSQKVIVIDAGGTNLRIALVSLADLSNPQIEYFENYPMLGTKGALTPDEFFGQLADKLAPIADKAKKIGFCFSFPASILPNRDAKIIQFTKEVKVPGAEGMMLGESLLAAMKAKGLPHDMTVAVINDTVAALLGGMVGTGGRVFDNFAGLILGTGTNTCYVESNSRVKKDAALAASSGKTLVNLESGGYGIAPRSDLDAAFDSTLDVPGEQMFEKMISGAYQGSLTLVYLKAAAKEGCFSPALAAELEAMATLSGKDIDTFVDFPYGDNLIAKLVGGNEADREAAYTLIDAFYDRVAMLITMNIAALLIRMDSGKSPWKPVCVSAEGTTFYKAKLFRPKLDYYMNVFVRQKLGLNYEFVKVDNSTIFGTATAGLLG